MWPWHFVRARRTAETRFFLSLFSRIEPTKCGARKTSRISARNCHGGRNVSLASRCREENCNNFHVPVRFAIAVCVCGVRICRRSPLLYSRSSINFLYVVLLSLCLTLSFPPGSFRLFQRARLLVLAREIINDTFYWYESAWPRERDLRARVGFQPVIELLTFRERIDFCLRSSTRYSVRYTMSLDRQRGQKRSALYVALI